MSNRADQITIRKYIEKNGTFSRREKVKGLQNLSGFITIQTCVQSYLNNLLKTLVNDC